MKKKADKLTQLAEDASADAEKNQREIEIATKVYKYYYLFID